MASVVAYFSVRKADEPADESHPYGHEKVENVAAAIEGMLILVGAGIIIYESVRRLVDVPEVESLGVGIAVIAFSGVANLVVSTYLYRQARATDSPGARGRRRAPAHRRRHLVRACWWRWCWWRSPASSAFDPIMALVVAVAIVVAGHPDPHALVARARGRGAARRRSSTRSGRRSRSTRAARWPASTSCAPAGPAAGATSTCTCSSATAPRCGAPTS